MENIALNFMFCINKLGLLRNYRPIHANEVAKAALCVANSGKSGIFVLNELFSVV
jgi:hypothetical protein